ncbi:hypothetical protein [Vibrio metschnikovii]|uniref:Uncharacterized protein n=1 Tax=Vibrio metschnikovii TaxID=28172 RepID=A0A9X0R9R7_VIBME|nr:hypothetical protein [Vibrio metschnikovii]MBC5851228.1 hypothetical protein [Vibrio metschnikovii]
MTNLTNRQITDAIKDRSPADILKNDAKIGFKVEPGNLKEDGFTLCASFNLSNAEPAIKHLLHKALGSKRSFANFTTLNDGTKLDSFVIKSEFTSFSLDTDQDKTYTLEDLKGNKDLQKKFLGEFAKRHFIQPLRTTMADYMEVDKRKEMKISGTPTGKEQSQESFRGKVAEYIKSFIPGAKGREVGLSI